MPAPPRVRGSVRPVVAAGCICALACALEPAAALARPAGGTATVIVANARLPQALARPAAVYRVLGVASVVRIRWSSWDAASARGRGLATACLPGRGCRRYGVTLRAFARTPMAGCRPHVAYYTRLAASFVAADGGSHPFARRTALGTAGCPEDGLD